jgi:hypothetical protein
MHWLWLTNLNGEKVLVNLAQARLITRGKIDGTPCTLLLASGVAVTVQGQVIDANIPVLESETEILAMKPLDVGFGRQTSELMRPIAPVSDSKFIPAHKLTAKKRSARNGARTKQ